MYISVYTLRTILEVGLALMVAFVLLELNLHYADMEKAMSVNGVANGFAAESNRAALSEIAQRWTLPGNQQQYTSVDIAKQASAEGEITPGLRHLIAYQRPAEIVS